MQMPQKMTDHDERIIKLEVKYKFTEKSLARIEQQMNKIAQDVSVISAAVSQHIGATTAKTKMWVVIYSSITVCATLGLHTLLFKYLGLHL